MKIKKLIIATGITLLLTGCGSYGKEKTEIADFVKDAKAHIKDTDTVLENLKEGYSFTKLEYGLAALAQVAGEQLAVSSGNYSSEENIPVIYKALDDYERKITEEMTNDELKERFESFDKTKAFHDGPGSTSIYSDLRFLDPDYDFGPVRSLVKVQKDDESTYSDFEEVFTDEMEMLEARISFLEVGFDEIYPDYELDEEYVQKMSKIKSKLKTVANKYKTVMERLDEDYPYGNIWWYDEMDDARDKHEEAITLLEELADELGLDAETLEEIHLN